LISIGLDMQFKEVNIVSRFVKPTAEKPANTRVYAVLSLL